MLCLACPPSSLAATTNVIVGVGGTLRFSPALVTIAAGDQIIWIWQGNFHTTTSGTVSNGMKFPDGLWDSGQFNAGHTFTNAFNAAGSFPFYCSTHFLSSMTGAVFVASGNIRPTVSITNPVPGAVFATPANITIQVSASESGGSVTNVQFWVGSTVLKNVAVAPFSATTNNLAAGSYTLTAIVSDSLGATATNSISMSVVTPLPVSLTNSTSIAGTNFYFSYLVNTGLSYVVQFTTNLAAPNWIPLVTNAALSNPAVFVDVHATNKSGFYRVGRMPNP